MKRAAALLCVVVCAGCLHKQLRAPVEDHRVQTSTIAEMCRSAGYSMPCSPELQADLDAMAEQAKLLDQIIKGEAPDAEEEGAE